jgi:ATP synthase protein I
VDEPRVIGAPILSPVPECSKTGRAVLDKPQPLKSLASYASVGLEFGLSLLVGLFAGRWLDRRFGTGNWLTFVGFGFGIAAGYRAIYRAAVRANREAEREEAEDRAQRQKYHDHSHPKPPGPSNGSPLD